MRRFKYFFCGRAFPFALLLCAVLAAYVALSLWLPRALAPIALAERLFSFSAGVYVVCSPALGESKSAKLLLLVLFPWTSALACLCFREKGTERTLPRLENAPRTAEQKIANLSKALCGRAPCSCIDAEYFASGKDACERLLADLKRAKRSIYLEFYIIARGALWNRILNVLEERASAGVRVRVIYDDFGCSLTLPRHYQKQLAARGVKALVFRPLRFPTPSSGERDHRKVAVIDDEIAYTGGINLADEYVGEKIRFGHWKDVAVRVTGTVSLEFSALFCEQWNALCKSERLSPAPLVLKKGTPCAVFADGTGGVRAGAAVHAALIGEAKLRISLCTPYLAPDEKLFSALTAAAGAGVCVRVMIPHVPDKRAVFALSRAYARKLERAGVACREYTAGFLHAKSLVADGQHCLVSSYNFDFRSMYLQAECGVYLRSAALASEMERDFDGMWETGTALKKATLRERFTGGLMRLFAPLV